MRPGTVNVLIEMPKGEPRRIHLDYTRRFYVNLGLTERVIKINKGKMPIAYGFVIGTITREGDELDALVYSKKRFRIGSRAKIRPFASLRIKNGDNKIIGTDNSVSVTEWKQIPKKQRDLLIKYFGYKSPVIKIGGREDALKLISNSVTKRPLPVPKGVIIKER